MAKARFYDRDPSAPAPNQPRALSVYALIERDGTLLLERRVDAPLWSVIAGGVEDDESLIDGLVREVREETGLTVSGYEFYGHFSEPRRIASYPDGSVVSLVTFAYIVSVESFDDLRPSAESEELRFFSKAELRDLDVPATQHLLFERYQGKGAPPYLD